MDQTSKIIGAIVKSLTEKGKYADEGGNFGASAGGTVGSVLGAAGGGGLGAVAAAPIGAVAGRAMGWSAGQGVDNAISAYKAVKPHLDKFASSFKSPKAVPSLAAGARSPSTKTPKTSYKPPKAKV